MTEDSTKYINHSSKTLKVLFIFSATLTLLNLLYGLIFPHKFVSIVGEGAFVVIIGFLMISAFIGLVLGLIPYENMRYKMRFRFWFLLIVGLYNIFYIYVNITEYW